MTTFEEKEIDNMLNEMKRYILEVHPHVMCAEDLYMDFSVDEFVTGRENAVKAIHFWNSVFTNKGWKPNFSVLGCCLPDLEKDDYVFDADYESEAGSIFSIQLQAVTDSDYEEYRNRRILESNSTRRLYGY